MTWRKDPSWSGPTPDEMAFSIGLPTEETVEARIADMAGKSRTPDWITRRFRNQNYRARLSRVRGIYPEQLDFWPAEPSPLEHWAAD